ncbi:hypothetical protein ACOSQ3_028194 [Xanthoceras sorbifolium]
MASSSISSKPLVILQKILLLAIISLFFFNNCNPVVADHDLMKSQCEITEAPALCMQCLESDPKSEKADTLGIAMIIVSCLSNNSQTTVSNFTSIVKNITNKNIKMFITMNCIEPYHDLIENISAVDNHLKKREYDQACDGLSTANDIAYACSDGIDRYGELIPGWVFYGMRVFDQLSVAAMRIIDHF